VGEHSRSAICHSDPFDAGLTLRMMLSVAAFAIVLNACSSRAAREIASKECNDKGYEVGSAGYLTCREQVIQGIQSWDSIQRGRNPVPATSPPPTMAPLFRF
jgi:hypothetical protein